MFLLQNLVLVAMVFVIFWVTMFPLISQAITGTKVSVGPPAFTPFVVPLALVLVALAGIGPLISWRRATVANLRRNFRFPVGVAAVVLIAVLALAHATSKPLAIAMWTLGAFVIGTVLQEFYRGTSARRAITHDAWPVALGALVRRNRRRYGGYMAHLGIAVLLIGVAASSSLQHSRDVVLKAGQSARVDGYRFTYVRPTEAAMASKIQFGAVLRVSKGGRHVTTMHTTRGYYPSTDFSTGVIGRFFAGEADSTVGLDAGVTRNLWAVTSANPQPLTGYINQGNRYFSAYLSSVTSRLSKLPRAQQTQFLDQYYTYRDEAVAGIARRFVTHPWPVEFLIIVAPLVTWVWVGAGIVAFGGLIALWPIPALVRLRSMAVYRARLARELA
jgi:cytochrome c-type biogenesis protein CcmF